MNPNDSLPSADGAINQATRFGERFGFPALITALLILGLMYGAYFVAKYEIFYNREQVEAMAEKMNTMFYQHQDILSRQESSLELQSKQIAINCAQCWNDADSQNEIRRCACTPPQ